MTDSVSDEQEELLRSLLPRNTKLTLIFSGYERTTLTQDFYVRIISVDPTHPTEALGQIFVLAAR